MTMKAMSASSPYSYTPTMAGCCKRPPACASSLKRATAEVDSTFARYSARIVLIATGRSMTGSNPS